MSELRQNRATKEWIIIARERAKRPRDLKRKEKEEKKLPGFDPTCPFCPGNEKMTPQEIWSKKRGRRWTIRVIPNKYPALVPLGELERETQGFFLKMSGVGVHEVIIETPLHNKGLGNLPLQQVEEVCLSFRNRFLELKGDKRTKMILIFRNHGESAGTSLVHPHSQLIALPLVPARIRHHLEEAMRYYDDHGSCVFCDMITEELGAKKRIIHDKDQFVAFHPFASRVPFETWILPKKHNASFGNISSDECRKMAFVLKWVLEKLYLRLGDPDYNLIIRTSPLKDREEDYYHWYVQILPRLATPAGFELGSGIYITTVLPEKSAEYIKGSLPRNKKG